VGGNEERPLPAQLRELGVEELRSRFVEGRVRLVEDEEPRLVQQDATEREALSHPPRVRSDALAPHIPKTEALEQHSDPLAPFGHAVQPAVKVEILERGELAIDERLVADVAELATGDAELDRPLRRRGKAGADPQERRLTRAVRPGHNEEAAGRELEIDATEDALGAVALAELRSSQHAPQDRGRDVLPVRYSPMTAPMHGARLIDYGARSQRIGRDSE
jgi:hypothetical protein